MPLSSIEWTVLYALRLEKQSMERDLKVSDNEKKCILGWMEQRISGLEYKLLNTRD